MNSSIERCRSTYEEMYQFLRNLGHSYVAAIEECAHNCLDGKPQIKDLTHINRSTAFWSCSFWENAPEDCYAIEAVGLALGRFLHFGASDSAIITRISKIAPDCLMQAIRHSQIFFQAKSPVWRQFVELADSTPEIFGDFLLVCDHLRETIESLDQKIIEKQKPLAELTIFETLLYGSIFTYRALAETDIHSIRPEHQLGYILQDIADILNQLLVWKLKSRPKNDFKLSEKFLAKSLELHFFSTIYPKKNSTNSNLKNQDLFTSLIKAVKNRNDFWSGVIMIFCYDDEYRCSFYDDQLMLRKLDPAKEPEWEKNGRKLDALSQYWLVRAGIEYNKSGLAKQPFGTPENDIYNREAFIKAMQGFLQLIEVYGLNADIEIENGKPIKLFMLLHSMELMTVFFKVEHIAAFQSYYQQSGDWVKALRDLSESGLRISRVRYPLAWEEPEKKARNILPCTVSTEHPDGNIDQAKTILDFWSSELMDISEKLEYSKSIIPKLYEKPILRLGRYGLQLPWLAATQNNSTAAINNLRRIGNKRPGRLNETHRIEERLGEIFEKRGFAVVRSYRPEVKDNHDPGEVDLLCFMDNHLFILEVKSSYKRMTLQDAWIHKTNTLRKASQQLKRKKDAILHALSRDSYLHGKLRIIESKNELNIHTWIVDTSTEYDQSYINGFLKVSLEALIVILRDEQQFLNANILNNNPSNKGCFFSDNFSARRFAEIVECGELWSFLDE
jgi:hypothetical protein